MTNPISNQPSDQLDPRCRSSRSALASFNSEESGLSTVEMLLLLFIGVVIIIAIIAYFWSYIWPTIQNIINNLFAHNTNT
jgi:hypothetical protein